ncbi:Chitotriosidase-1 [Frankliniella fusca]|uniref:Chitotriosidase-1 n=1 Tax=Frankliniella fusca TaxID=407009 RepID=A0AAE1HRL5_9NEOP|nr:Chitotriosidase-1 [Frankliniella fusca]
MGARVVPIVNPEVRYEHLGEEPYKIKTAYKQLFLFGFALSLVIFLILVTAYNGWEDIFNPAPKREKTDNLDFMMYGPVRSELGVQGIRERQADLYAKAFNKKHKFLMKPPNNIFSKTDEEQLLANSPYVWSTPAPDGFKLVCYYALPPNVTVSDDKTLMPNDLDAYLCTHINLAFASVVNNSLVPSHPNDVEAYDEVVELKKQNPNLKVLLSVNGDMSQVVQDHVTRKTFIKSSLDILRKHKLDGLDIDWEFPDDAWKFMTLLAEFRQAFGDRYLLTAAVAAPQVIVDMSYKIDVMSRFVDWVNLMTYDFHFYTRFTPYTGLNAPLYKSQKDKGYFSQLNTNWTVHYWEDQGMPRNKIVVGVPTYGHTFKLQNKKNTGLYAPSCDFGDLGGGGFIDYPDVCRFLTTGAVQTFDRSSRASYAFKNRNWIAFEDERSAAYKGEFITSGGYGGAMVWSLNADDYKGLCYKSGLKFPLIRRLKIVLTDDML